MAFSKTSEGQTAANANPVTSFPVTLPTVNAGDYLEGQFTQSNTGTPTFTSVIDSLGQTWLPKLLVRDTGNSQIVQQWYFPNSAAGTSVVVTVTLSASNNYTAGVCHAWGGVDTAVGFDIEAGQFQASAGTGTDAVTSTAATTAQADLIVGGSWDTSTGNADATPGTGFTGDIGAVGVSGGATIFGRSEHLVQGAAGSTASTFTQASNNARITLMMAMLPAAGPAAGPAPFVGRRMRQLNFN